MHSVSGRIALALFILLSIVVFIGWKATSVTTLTIGLVVPDQTSPQGKAMVQAAKLALKTLNRDVKARPVRYKLNIQEDHNDPQLASHIVHQLATSNTLITVGHAASSVNNRVAPIYQKIKLAMINASATTSQFFHHNDWAFSTMTSAALQGSFLMQFIKNTTNRSGIYIFESDDASNKALADVIAKTAQSLGINIIKRWRVDSKEQTSEQQLDAILETIRNDPKQEQHALLIASNVDRGVQLITSLKRTGHQLMVLTPHNFADNRFIDTINQYPQARAQPGYYSDGIFVITPYLSQAGLTNQTVVAFQKRYRKQYKTSPQWLAAAWYDATLAAGRSIARLDDHQLRSHSTATLRSEIRDQLRNAYTYEKGFDGVNGRIYFNPNGEAFRALAIGFFSRQRMIPSDQQFQPIIYPERELHLLKDVLDKKVFIGINGQLFRKTRVIYTGIDFNRIGNLNLIESSFDTNFYLWFRYRGTFDDRNIEFINATEPIVLGDPIVTDSSNGMTTHAYRVQGTFRSHFDFHNYPFDKQALKIEFKHQHAQKDELLYVTDIEGLRQGFKRQRRSSIHLGGWAVQPTTFFQEIASTSSTLGVPRFMENGNLIEYSQFTASITLVRDALNFVIKHLMTLVILLIVTYIIYYLPPNQMELSGGITMTSLLTAAVMHQEMNASLPEVGYTVAIDYVFFISYAMMALSALYPLIQYNRARAKRSLSTIHMVGRIGYPIGVFSIIVTMYYLLNTK